jgi:hypothetical protein
MLACQAHAHWGKGKWALACVVAMLADGLLNDRRTSFPEKQRNETGCHVKIAQERLTHELLYRLY